MENREYQKIKSRTDIYTDSGAEYVIPDYNGDIRKIIFTEARLRPAGRFAGGGETEFTGIVVYNVVYTDPDGELCSASFSSDYEYKIKTSEEQYVDAVSDARVANLSVRATGPRKISAKASISASVTVIESASLAVSGSAFERETPPEMLTERVNVRSTVLSESVEREYAEVLASLDGAIADEVRVIYSGADIEIDDADLEDGVLEIEGELTLFAVIKNGNEPAFVAERSIDISQRLPFDAADPSMSFIPDAVVVSLKDSINSTETGTDVVLSAIVEYSATAQGNIASETVADAYVRDCVCENTYDDFHYSEFVGVVSASEPHEISAPRSELECEPLREIVVMSAEPKIESCEASGDTLTVTGEIKVSGIASGISDNGDVVYSPVKFSSEFTKNVKLDCQIDEKMRIEPKICISRPSGSVDAENVYASACVKVFASIFRDKCSKVLVSCEAKEEQVVEKGASRIRVYYPTKDETLFSVAKKFNTSSAKVALDNAMSAAVSADGSDISLASVKKLMIY